MWPNSPFFFQLLHTSTYICIWKNIWISGRYIKIKMKYTTHLNSLAVYWSTQELNTTDGLETKSENNNSVQMRWNILWCNLTVSYIMWGRSWWCKKQKAVTWAQRYVSFEIVSGWSFGEFNSKVQMDIVWLPQSNTGTCNDSNVQMY